ncbi:MAG: Cobyrinic acid a,c-diamide synthase [Thermoanaerobacterales bacterium 50_218]|nr:MAG: Cobyrinic acid a,c-diamide synthase [Thermoanaerobacterales bacterium 50_218]HAA89989.1 (4Fe-4S)-binding protein [Peptococcaceae bacterium]
MIITVLSGKGGTGKTTVAVNLALSLAEEGHRVLLLDADVEEPNAGLYLDLVVEETFSVDVLMPKVDESLCTYCGKCAEFCQFNALAVIGEHVLVFSELCHGCGGCSLVCPVEAIREVPRLVGTIEKGRAGSLKFWSGRMKVGEALAVPVTRKLKEGLAELKDEFIVIIDAPPGSSCPVVEAVRGSDYALLVTEPTPFGKHDFEIALGLVRDMEFPHGVIINRSGDDDKLIEDYCREQDVPVLLKIPFSPRLAALGARGIPFSKVIPYWRDKFRQVYRKIKESCRCASW